MSRVWLRWTPAIAAVAVVAGVAIAIPAAANASVSLPDKSPARLLALVASSRVTALSGDVTETSDLGLPSLPTTGTGSSEAGGVASDLALLTGSNSLRVYVNGPKNVRLQVLTSLAERDVILHGSDLWTYDSKGNTVEHATLTAPHHGARPAATPSAEPQSPVARTPEGLAHSLLAQLEPTSTVTVGGDVLVAGRSAYDLVLTPKASDTLIGSVSIAVDSATGLPLRVEIDAAGQTTPAVSIGFTTLTLATPSGSLFSFTPPAGAHVTEVKTPSARPAHTPDAAKKPAHTVTGTGWDAVVTVAASGSLAKLAGSSEFTELTTPVPGGRVLHTSLVNILFTSDGRIVAGSVSVDRLEAVATGS
jgi:outer membrane lipoprotein-sorting protein